MFKRGRSDLGRMMFWTLMYVYKIASQSLSWNQADDEPCSIKDSHIDYRSVSSTNTFSFPQDTEGNPKESVDTPTFFGKSTRILSYSRRRFPASLTIDFWSTRFIKAVHLEISADLHQIEIRSRHFRSNFQGLH